MNEVVLGIDVGTQGVRVLAATADGTVLASAQEPLAAPPQTLPAGWFEQSPRDWWRAAQNALRRVMAELPGGTKVAGISVDSTSGTVLAVDGAGEPLTPALMYNDQRSEEQAAVVQQAAAEHQRKFGYVFGSSYALPKILWIKQTLPDAYAQVRWFLHAADYINGKLTGEFGRSDTSNALKTGYDLIDLRWPEFIERDLGIDLEKLPEVSLPGARIGNVSPQAAQQTGLPAGVPVLAGATDGTAAQIASGAARPGEWNSTLGTTLVLKGVSQSMTPDALGRVYYHRHPEGWWMPGGASNTGTDWMLQEHGGVDLDDLNRQAAAIIPTGLVRYPLAKTGERFPFLHPAAQGFLLGEAASAVERYAAGLEGLALIERLAYETLQGIGLEVGSKVFITGGGAKSRLWSQIRATVLDKCLAQPAVIETAFGAAVIAASGCWYPTLSEAAGQMVRVTETIEPVAAWRGAYEAKYGAFVKELRGRGYI